MEGAPITLLVNRFGVLFVGRDVGRGEPNLEWVIGLLILLAIGALSGDGKKSLKKKARGKAKTIAVKDFIEPGREYAIDEAKEVIRQFVEALGDSKGYRWVNSAKEVSESFPRLLAKLKQVYEDDLAERIKDYDQSQAEYEQLIQAVLSDPELDDEEKQHDAKYHREDMADEAKEAQKLKKWYEKQISPLDENPTPILKKVLALLKREHREDNPPPDLAGNWDEFEKEPPL